jgi:hypothetical protein
MCSIQPPSCRFSGLVLKIVFNRAAICFASGSKSSLLAREVLETMQSACWYKILIYVEISRVACPGKII